MSDLVERLRDRAYSFRIVDRLCEEAADEIARLRLTDEERECLEWAEEIAGNCEEFSRVEVLRGLLERTK